MNVLMHDLIRSPMKIRMTNRKDDRKSEFGQVIFRLGLLSVFLICFAAGRSSFAAPASATPAGSSQPANIAPSQSTTASAAGSNPDALWHALIWQELPIKGLNHTERAIIIKAYQENDWKPFFINDRLQPAARVQTLLQALSQMNGQGLDPAPYHLQDLFQQLAALQKLQPTLHSGTPTSASGRPTDLAAATTDAFDPGTRHAVSQLNRTAYQKASRLDMRLATCLVRYAREMNPLSSRGQVKALLGKIPLSDFLRQLQPTSPHYAPLCRALAKYRHLAMENVFFTLPQQTLRVGDSGPAVRRLQIRLHQEGYYSGTATGRFDHATRTAVQTFQRTHMLAADGVVGPHTLARLNVSYHRQAELIALSLKLLRHSHARMFQRFVWVNIPQFELEYYRHDQLQSVHRVIVGRAGGAKTKTDGRPMTVNQTPTMVSSIKEVVINPRWYVSDRIRLELNKDVAKDPNYFSDNGYVEMSSSYPWGAPRLFQRPGPTNPLGRVKFEFRNPYAIYLHDTPAKQYFKKPRRDLSHGCIRMSDALIFARRLFEDDHNRAAHKMDDYLQSERQIFVRLHHPVPIIVDYVPVSTNQAGQIVFCGDPYGWYKS